jgi:hypothetical protein
MTTIGQSPTFKVSVQQRRLQPGRASDYIRHAQARLKLGTLVLACCRVSGRERKRKLADQEVNLRQVCERYGAILVDVVMHVGSGADPFWIGAAAKKAKELNAVLLAETTDRFVRHPDFHSSKNADAQAREADIELLAECADGVDLLTDLHPDAPPSEVRSYQRLRGRRATGHTGGRPTEAGYKKRRRQRLKPPAIKMCKDGMSFRKISAVLHVAESTVRSWLKQVKVERSFLRRIER